MTNWSDVAEELKAIYEQLNSGTLLTNGTILASIDIDLDQVEDKLNTLDIMNGKLNTLDIINGKLNTLSIIDIDLAAVYARLGTINIKLDDLSIEAGTVTFLSSAERDTSSVSSTIDAIIWNEGFMFLDVSAVQDTFDYSACDLDVVLETKDPIASAWYALNTISVSTIGISMIKIIDFGGNLRLNYTLTGSTMTFSAGALLKE